MSKQQKRQKSNKLPGKIVRRTRPAVGQQRKVIRRSRPVIGGAIPMEAAGNRRILSWRPGARFVGAMTALLTVVIVGGSGFALYQSPIFEISKVEVRGNNTVSTEAIAERSKLLGEQLFSADLADAQASIYEIPLLASVRIEREWPNTVVVHVEERQPWGAWEQGGVTYTIDREGIVIGTDPAPEGSPVIVSSEIGSRQLGDRVNHHAVEVAADIYELLPREMGTNVTEVAFLTEGGGGVKVTTSDGEVALLGDSSGINYKLAVWAEVTARAQAEGIDYSIIDLRYGNRPVLQ